MSITGRMCGSTTFSGSGGGNHMLPPAAAACCQPRCTIHASASSGAAQAAPIADATGEGSFVSEDPLFGAPGDPQLADMIEPQFLDTQGGRIAYHALPATGSHLTGVIYCGGLNSNMNGMKATMLEMHARRNSHPYVRFDYRGHGASSGEFLDTTLGDWYQDTLDVIDRVALPGQHILVGSSIGGWIALKAAAARRERIKGLVLLAPAVDITELWWDALSEEERSDARATGFVPLGRDTEYAGRVRTSFFDEASDHCVLDVAAREAQVRCPVRILQGAADTVVPPFVANEVVAWLESRDVHLTLVKDGDHRLLRPEDLRTLMLAVEELLALDTQRVSST